jgi:hypothetical protein
MMGDVKNKKSLTPKLRIENEIQSWVVETYFSRSWDTKVFQEKKFYLMEKSLVAKDLE